MAQNVIINGVTYQSVPEVDIPKSGGGTAKFMDTSDADATADDILTGKTAYVNGVKLTGTGQGGGSSSPYDVIIQCTNINGFTNNTSDYVWRVGTKTEIIAKMKAGEPISGIAYCKKGSYDDEDEAWAYETSILTLNDWSYYDYGYDEAEAIVIDFALNNMAIYSTYTMVRRQYLIVNLTNEDPNYPISYVFTDQTMNLKKN